MDLQSIVLLRTVSPLVGIRKLLFNNEIIIGGIIRFYVMFQIFIQQKYIGRS